MGFKKRDVIDIIGIPSTYELAWQLEKKGALDRAKSMSRHQYEASFITSEASCDWDPSTL